MYYYIIKDKRKRFGTTKYIVARNFVLRTTKSKIIKS